ncbi:magnesium transporter [Candidatus Roizmanbacteria bacterium]|nr:magnesium transporter [Candidatus Roizmanbacteria bacterium]
MLYFADLKNRKVYTEDNVLVGNLHDLFFKASEKSVITKLVVRDSKKQLLVVPLEYVKKTAPFVLSKSFETVEPTEQEVSVVRNLLDKQIIDIKGNKIVRVNDVAFHEKPKLLVAGVDIGIVGILRWFQLEDILLKTTSFLKLRITSHFLSWGDIQPLELTRGKVVIKTIEEKLERIHPEDLADHLEKTTILNARKILNSLDEEYAAEVIGNLNINYQTALFKNFHASTASKVLELIDPDEAVDILLTLSPRRRRHIISLISPEQRQELEHLLKYSKTPIGGLLTTEYVTVTSDKSVREVIDKIKRETKDFSAVHYVYVLNKAGELTGVFSLHEMILQSLDTRVFKFMVNDVIVVHLTTPKELVVKKMLKYRFMALPVIDKQKKIIGVVTFDDVSEEMGRE